MNKKASIGFIILFAVFYFFAGMILYQFLKPDIDLARTDMACSSSQTSGDRISCLLIDGVIPLVVITITSAAGGYVTDKLRWIKYT